MVKENENKEKIMKERNIDSITEEELTDIEIKREIIEYTKASLLQEEEREKSILEECNSNMTVLSILLVALIPLIFELLDRLKNISTLIVIFGFFLIFILFSSLFFSLKARCYYKKAYRRRKNDLINHIKANSSTYSKKAAFLDQMIDDIDCIHGKLLENNNKRKNDIVISSILIYLFLGLIFIFSISVMIIV